MPIRPFLCPRPAGRGSKHSAKGNTEWLQTARCVPSDTWTIRFLKAELNSSTCQLGEHAFYAQDRIPWDCSKEGLGKVGGDIYCHFLISLDVIGAPCLGCHPSYSCFLGHRDCVLCPTDQRSAAARDQAGKVKQLMQHFCQTEKANLDTQQGADVLTLSSACLFSRCFLYVAGCPRGTECSDSGGIPFLRVG